MKNIEKKDLQKIANIQKKIKNLILKLRIIESKYVNPTVLISPSDIPKGMTIDEFCEQYVKDHPITSQKAELLIQEGDLTIRCQYEIPIKAIKKELEAML